MNGLRYRGRPAADLPGTWAEDEREHPARYRPESGLVHALDVALTLDKPLLVTGEPGTGKTRLAYHLAWALGLDRPLKFDATSSMQARDLFYTFDALGRFHAAQGGPGGQGAPRTHDAADFVTLQALGLALVRSLDTPDGLPESLAARFCSHAIGARSLVLIDEIDKAPRDVPNDLLNQIEHMYFRIPECAGIEVQGNLARRPVLIFTSNSERFLPDAFLRRCIFYDIPYPDQAQLEIIVQQHLELTGPGAPLLVRQCISLIDYLRSADAALARKPGPAELLDWLKVLVLRGHDLEQPLADEDEIVIATACTLVKNRDDQGQVAQLIRDWRTRERATDHAALREGR